MYNKDLPTRAELPSTARLIRSTIIAAMTALVLLFTVVLPAEYAIDPTGIGRVLGLTEMGEIKKQLTEEAALVDAAVDVEVAPVTVETENTPAVETIAEEPATSEAMDATVTTETWTDELTTVLAPGEAAEVKLFMDGGDVAQFEWTAAPGHLNSTLHGNGTNSEKITYRNGRAEIGHEGELTAEFDGRHGWFWRNRSDETVTLTLRVKGSYNEIKRVL